MAEKDESGPAFALDFTKEEATQALVDYALKNGADIPSDGGDASLYSLGSNFKREGYYFRLAFAARSKGEG